MSIDLTRLIADLESALGCPYVSPGTTDWSRVAGGVDCSGLLAAAFRHQGGSLPHGSNAIARRYTEGMAELKSAEQLFPGAAVFKWQRDGAPARYTDGLGNWHHIGLVVSAAPLRIIHASSAKGCVTADTAIGGWTHLARLKGIDYSEQTTEQTEGEDIMSENYVLRVTAARALLIRAGASRKSAIQGRLKSGAQVEADLLSGGWYRLADGKGWICGDYVEVLSEPAAASVEEDRLTDLEDLVAELADRVTALEELYAEEEPEEEDADEP